MDAFLMAQWLLYVQLLHSCRISVVGGYLTKISGVKVAMSCALFFCCLMRMERQRVHLVSNKTTFRVEFVEGGGLKEVDTKPSMLRRRYIHFTI